MIEKINDLHTKLNNVRDLLNNANHLQETANDQIDNVGSISIQIEKTIQTANIELNVGITIMIFLFISI